MKLLSLILALFCAGCLTFRQSVGGPIERAGEATGKFGSCVLIVAGATIVLIPVGIAIGLPILLVGAPLYYGGCWLVGDKPGQYPNP